MARNVDMLGAHTHQGGPTWVGADTDRVLISFSIGCDDRCPPSEPLWCVPLSEGGLCWRRLLPQSFLSQRSSLPPLVPCLLLLFLLFLRGQLPATGALGEADGARRWARYYPFPIFRVWGDLSEWGTWQGQHMGAMALPVCHYNLHISSVPYR